MLPDAGPEGALLTPGAAHLPFSHLAGAFERQGRWGMYRLPGVGS